MLWWFDGEHVAGRSRGTRSRPRTSTLTPVVFRISHDQARAHLWAKRPDRSKNDRRQRDRPEHGRVDRDRGDQEEDGAPPVIRRHRRAYSNSASSSSPTLATGISVTPAGTSAFGDAVGRQDHGGEAEARGLADAQRGLRRAAHLAGQPDLAEQRRRPARPAGCARSRRAPRRPPGRPPARPPSRRRRR